MSSGLDSQKLNIVFQSRPDIVEGIRQAADSPSRIKLFNNIVDFVYEQLNDTQSSEPAQKRRRVDVEPPQNGQLSHGAPASSADDVSQEAILLEIKDISVSIPQRKKFDLCFTANHLYARVSGTKALVPGMIFPWKNIEYAFYLPVPEKSQVQHNYVLLPHNSYFPSQTVTTTVDPLVFTIPATAPKPGSIGGPNASAASAVSDSYSTLFNWAINKCLQAGKNQVRIVAADPSKFHSVIRQPHRPKEQAVHVKAFRGSKDGYLFFLENGILWGFKKPLMFLPLDKIAAISYTSVLQRTFNMVVEVYTGEGGGDEEATEEIEFAMLDQEDYNGINENYVTRHKLQDRSLADQRKAKRELAENLKGKKGTREGEPGEDGGVGEDGMTELERAQLEAEQQLQDEEDEDEEDYDPGSEGDSEGSGLSSDDDDDDDDDDDAAGEDEEDEAEDD
ncbi:Rtt106-domain-containing protein [Xylariaceae sp. AK1471]|nr:Rtt106-domain-containing protein [Xylariaceae sp. AK1471]